MSSARSTVEPTPESLNLLTDTCGSDQPTGAPEQEDDFYFWIVTCLSSETWINTQVPEKVIRAAVLSDFWPWYQTVTESNMSAGSSRHHHSFYLTSIPECDESPGSALRTQCEACELPSRYYYTYITHIWGSLAITVPASPQMTSCCWALKSYSASVGWTPHPAADTDDDLSSSAGNTHPSTDTSQQEEHTQTVILQLLGSYIFRLWFADHEKIMDQHTQVTNTELLVKKQRTKTSTTNISGWWENKMAVAAPHVPGFTSEL